MKLLIRMAALACLALTTQALAKDKMPDTWDGLQHTPSKAVGALYVAQGATLAPYKTVLIDKVQVAFQKDWARDMTSRLRLSMSQKDRDKILQGISELFQEVLTKELTDGGYTVVTTAQQDTLRLSTAIADLYINAPDVPTPGRVESYVVSAGQMTLIAEMRDGESNALLARALDKREGSDTGHMQWANRVTNTAEAKRIMRIWASALVKALNESKKGTTS